MSDTPAHNVSDTPPQQAGFDRAAAVTRSLLGYGVVAGAFYLIVGVVQALIRDGFDLARHPLSVLMLGDFGWVQRTNAALSGLMVIAAAVGFARAMRDSNRSSDSSRRSGSTRGTWTARLVAAYGGCLIASGIFPPDPVAGFPPGASAGVASASGVLHFAFGAVGFLCLAAATLGFAAWCAARGEATAAWYSRTAGAIVAAGFVTGAVASGLAAGQVAGEATSQVVGVVALWIAVVAGWAWLAAAAIRVYRTVPHPDTGLLSRS